jgi:hypothetical protein
MEITHMPKSELKPCDHRCSLEFVPDSKRPRESYVVLDGQRIACAGVRLATGKPGWVPLIEGYEAADEPPGHITVFCPITDGNGDEMNTAPTSGPAIEAT